MRQYNVMAMKNGKAGTGTGLKKDRKGFRYFGLGFLIPFIVTFVGFALIKVWPFGDGTVLIIDSIHQYLPFYTVFHDKLVSGQSLFYSFQGGFGFDFWATAAYYLASPINLLMVFIPTPNVADFMDFAIVLKIGLCGGTFSWYLHKRDPDRKFMPVVFGTMFALSNFMIGYYFNLMWLESVAMLPVMMYGIEKIVKGGEGRTYALSLFYGIWCNYYIGFMLCIFSVLYMISQLFADKWTGIKSFLRRVLVYAWYSVLAGGMASMVLMPAYASLKSSEAMQNNTFPQQIKFYTNFIDIMLQHFAAAHPINISDTQVGLNAYCGVAVMIFALMYVLDTKIAWKEKLTKVCLTAFLMLSFSLNILNYIWHGFHLQNGLPNRFAFIYIALLLIMSYDTTAHIRQMRPETILLSSLVPIVFCFTVVATGYADQTYDQKYGAWNYATPILLCGYMLLLLLSRYLKVLKKTFPYVLGAALLFEACVHAIYGIEYNENVTRSIYLADQASYKKLTADTDKSEFFRSEIDSQRMRNVTMYAGGNSVIMFNSTMLQSVTNFCDKIGMESRTNKNGYNGVTKLMNDVFGIRYVLSSNAKAGSDSLYQFTYVDGDGNLRMFENKDALAVGFMVNPDIREWDIDNGDNPIEVQNAFVRLATGIDGLYTLDRTIEAENGQTYDIKVPDDKQVYVYCPNRVASIELDTPEYTRTYTTFTDHLYVINSSAGNDIAHLTVTLNAGQTSETLYVYTCPNSTCTRIAETLAKNQMTDVRVTGSSLTGSIHVDEAGTLMMTVPCEEGWTITVDGHTVTPYKIAGTMTGFDLDEGDHKIEMHYMPGGFRSGVSLTVLCAVLFILTQIWVRRERKQCPEKRRHDENDTMITVNRGGDSLITDGRDADRTVGQTDSPEQGGSMKLTFSKKAEEFKPGIFTQLNEKKEELLAQGRKIYNLSVGTPDFRPQENIIRAVEKSALEPENYRYSLRDMPELLEAMQSFYKKRFGVDLKTDEIMTVNGSQEGMAHIAWALCDPGDLVLVPNPGYPIFKIGPELCGCETWEYPLYESRGYLPDLDAIPEDICRRARMMIVSYPGNPFCRTAPDEFYDELIAFAQKYNIIILHDNAYADIVFGDKEGGSFLQHEGAREVGVEFYSLSKTFDYTGARLSFVLGNAQIIEKFKVIRSQIDYGVFYPVQYGAIAALTGPLEPAREQCREYERRSRTLTQGLRSIGWNCPDTDGTMFVWAPLPDGYTDSEKFVMKLMEASGVICTPGSSFGSLGEGYVRFALVLEERELEEAVQAIQDSGILKQE